MTRPSPPGRPAARIRRALLAGVLMLTGAWASTSCVLDTAPKPMGRTPAGTGATVRYDLSNRPLPAIPLPMDTATWPDPTSRTGLRINASLVAPTTIERQARERFSRMEGWGTFAPISVSFDIDRQSPTPYDGPALDLGNVRSRHQGDDFDFDDDAIYLVNLTTGVPVPLDLGAGNFDYTLERLDRYWANDYRQSERNLLFETIDETRGGAVKAYDPALDTDFDGVLDVPNFENPGACPPPHPICDDPASGGEHGADACVAARRARDRCVADNLLTWYERETDTLIARPLLPLEEMTRYAMVVTNRTLDGRGEPVRSPFELVYHAAQRSFAERVAEVIDTAELAGYFGDIAGSSLGNVAFLWGFTTQPTVDDMKRLRDGLYGRGPFGRWAAEFPPELELQRSVGLTAGLAEGKQDVAGWATSPQGVASGCPSAANNLYKLDYEQIREKLQQLLVEGFGVDDGPAAQLLLRQLDNISHMVIGTYRVPFLLEGGPRSTDPNAAFDLDFTTGQGFVTDDVVQFWLIVPKETAEHRQPFDVNIYGHGYTANFVEMVLYAGNMAEQGLATIGINAMGHGLVFDDNATVVAATAALGGACYAPFFDALTLSRARDLNNDGTADSGGDFWSSYLFHTRDGVRQSVLDHIQLVRIMRAFGSGAAMRCRNDADPEQPVRPCDFGGDGLDLAGDFDGDGRVDAGGPDARYGTWGESLGGILSGIHGAIDAYVTSAVPGSGGGGLTDIGVRSFQGGVVEAVLLRIWGPLLVTVPARERGACTPSSRDRDRCTRCGDDQMSLRWVVPDLNGTGEVEIECLEPGLVRQTTVKVVNLDNQEVRCARVGDDERFRVGLPASLGDRVLVGFWDGAHKVDDYGSCNIVGSPGLRHTVEQWGPGRVAEGTENGAGNDACGSSSCAVFQGVFYGEGTPLVAPAHGFGLPRQSPDLRRFLTLAQAALEPGDPISFAPFYALQPMTDPFGEVIAPHALLTLNTIGDMNVPLNAGIAFARAAGALPFLRPDQADKYPHHVDYVTPDALYAALSGRTPNQELIDRHVIEGIAPLARHPADAECETSANAAPLEATYLDPAGEALACFPGGCTAETEASGDTRICYSRSHCEIAEGASEGRCVPDTLGRRRCEEALWDADDLDEGKMLFSEQASPVPHRLARVTASARDLPLDQVWAPRLLGVPGGSDEAAYQPVAPPAGRLTALLNAYVVPEGTHTFVNGEPCQAFDINTYLTNLVARFFASDGTDLYYLTHPESHHCLETSEPSCPYLVH